MNEEWITLENIEIPEISTQDILETIQYSQKIIKRNRFKKETKFYKTFLDVFRLQVWKSFVIESVLVVCILIVAWMHIKFSLQSNTLALLMLFATMLSSVIAVEFLSSDFFGMQEVERACGIAFERLLLWKMLLLTLISIAGILVVSLYLSFYSEYNFWVLLSGGCVPFFFINALILHFFKHHHVINIFVVLYAFLLSLSFLMESTNIAEYIASFLERWGVFTLTLIILYWVITIFHKRYRRDEL
ncbi:hypothetical protein ACWG0P_11570 [Amedibacillus sp. YH-ame6]